MQSNSRIVGGVDTPIGGQPWTVSIKLYGRHTCGGSIVERDLVVTAAHCVYPVLRNRIKHLVVVAGEYDQGSEDPEQQDIPVSDVKLHPKYKHDGSMVYDIALVYLQKPIILGSRVQRVCLPQEGEKIEQGTLCVTSGWGKLHESGEMSPILQEVTLPILDDETCRLALASIGLPAFHKSMLCAGFPDGGKDACQGDSGGPLVCRRRRSNTWVLFGSTSWGAGCGRAWGVSTTDNAGLGSPAIFAKASALVDIFRNVTSDSESNCPNTASCGHNLYCALSYFIMSIMYDRVIYFTWIKLTILYLTGGCRASPLVIVAKNGFIKYPLNEKSNYSSNSLCRWMILSSADKIIKIQFISLDVEDHVRCAYDSLTFTANSKDVRKVCGSILPSPLIIRSSNVTVTFVSDGAVNGQGFHFKFSALSAESEKGSGCGSPAKLTEEGKIFTLNYPRLYPSNTACCWVIEAPEDHVIQLVFEDFALEYQEKCEYDRVVIYGDREESHQIVTLCGFSAAHQIFSPGNIMVIKFESDYENNYGGFMARFSFTYPDKMAVVPSIKASTAPNQEPKRIKTGVCGVAPLSPQWLLNRIVGGEEACPNCWPWQVAIMYRETFQCGGVILLPQWVLTAAHCLPSTDPSRYHVVAGIHDQLLKESSRQERAAHIIVPHKMYSPITNDYDIALIRLAEELIFNDVVRPVCLPSAEEPLKQTSLCVVTGWGSTEEDEQHFNRLQQLQVPILDNNICNSSYYPGVISERMFCAGFPDTGGKDSCQGDSGGPLVCPSSDKSHVLYGIVSWGVGCARPKKPGVYTRVRSFLSWIESTQQEVNKTLYEDPNALMTPMHIKGEEFLPAACPNDFVLDDVVGSIASPGFPHGYAGGLICSWVISAPSPHSLIKIILKHLSIEKSANCVTESLTIYHEKENNSNLIEKMCGFPPKPVTYETRGPMVRVVFISAHQGLYSRIGFHLQYKIFGEGVRDFMETDWRKTSTQESCDDVIVTKENGVISSPGYPAEYPNDLGCQWRIIAPRKKIIRLDIDTLSTEKDETGCQDVLQVYQGIGENKVLLGSCCGNISDYAVKSNGSEMTLLFNSNSRVSMKGFFSRYSFWLQTDSPKTPEDLSILNCPTLKYLKAGSLDVKSPGYPEAYLNGLDCWWNISSESGNKIELNLKDLMLEDSPNCTWDFLNIYDGASDETKLLVTLCGIKSNSTFSSSSGVLTLHFHTDVSVSGRGFHIHCNEENSSSIQTMRSTEVVADYEKTCGMSLVDPMPETKSASVAEYFLDEKGRTRVVRGQTAAYNSWPWIVSVQNELGHPVCGAIIIHEKWLLTAAHCGYIVGTHRVFIGHIDRTNGIEAIVLKSYVHELYDDEKFPPDYDICLLELKFPVILGESVAVMCLPQKDEQFDRDSCLTAGWGTMESRSLVYPKLLQQAKVPLKSKEECMEYWDTDISERNVCGGAAGASSCSGDSGGPLICRSGNKYTLVGVVSWGSGMCETSFPAVYSLKDELNPVGQSYQYINVFVSYCAVQVSGKSKTTSYTQITDD
ncbi:ovochymase-1 [Dendropsophus ebraccatus]|uniref:ovochymase-1 n=1 Tax=Dendropsophus ebraccatus TaxID=150705 RepID=UPI003831B795